MNEPRGNVVPADAWEREYREGVWQYLRGIEEMGRYALISGHVRRVRRGSRILDIGCGEGILYDHLEGTGVGDYMGIDLSVNAAAMSRVPPGRGTIVVGDVETHAFAETERFGAIVLNEVLYYCREPVRVVRRCLSLLEPSGVVIVSMFDAAPATPGWGPVIAGIWEALARGPWRTLDEARVAHLGSRRSWTLRVLGAIPGRDGPRCSGPSG